MVDYYEMEKVWQKVVTPGVVPPVEHLPFLKYLPKFLAPWKTYCETAKRLQHELFYGLLRETKTRMAQGYENGCFIEKAIARQAEIALSDEQIAYLGGVLIEGGEGTTASWLKALVLAMVVYPDAQKKAQEELDKVVGDQRIPSLEDLPFLPYIQAIIKEVHRWRPVGPLGIDNEPDGKWYARLPANF
ncbi:cytochrome P450 family protein [Ceratobasidium sp. AG-Ba]|nr:cytochrome P450 family protein [Ceratobasidium sp. AG-Ba]QRW04466.1 cytochrome P450 family protein [Ceratobasidium sp. AG-Ba]